MEQTERTAKAATTTTATRRKRERALPAATAAAESSSSSFKEKGDSACHSSEALSTRNKRRRRNGSIVSSSLLLLLTTTWFWWWRIEPSEAFLHNNNNHHLHRRQYRCRQAATYSNEESSNAYSSSSSKKEEENNGGGSSSTSSSISQVLQRLLLQQQQRQQQRSTAPTGTRRSSRSSSNNKSNNNRIRQRFVTGQYPVIVTLQENNPTLKWLQLGKNNKNNNNQYDTSTTVLLVNGTAVASDPSHLASLDRYDWWLDDAEREELHHRYDTVSVELLAEISMEKPGYLAVVTSSAATTTTTTTTTHGSGGSGGPGASAQALKQQKDSGMSLLRWNNKWRKEEDDQEDDTGENNTTSNAITERLWITGFSLAPNKNGILHTLDIKDGRIDTINARSKSMLLWPNEVQPVPAELIAAKEKQQQSSSTTPTTPRSSHWQDAVLVSDGFLVPGKDRGGIYVVQHPSNTNLEWSVCLTNPLDETYNAWFYHRAVWVDLTGDGRQSILTARAKLSRRKASSSTTATTDDTTKSNTGSFLNDNDFSSSAKEQQQQQSYTRPRNGQLVWLEMPKPHHIDRATGTPLEKDGTAFDPFSARHLPWKERVLATGPDVMFAVADLDESDDTIEVLASEFFDKKVTLHSIQKGATPRVVFRRDIDNQCGAAFGGILANLDASTGDDNGDSVHRRVIDSGSTVSTLERGDTFSHFLATSHECNYEVEPTNEVAPTSLHHHQQQQQPSSSHSRSSTKKTVLKGGSLFAYRVPRGSKDAWKIEPWKKTTVATGFQVKSQIWNVINPGAPGFCYTFHAHQDDKSKGKRPMIAVAGDCAESAYIFRPQLVETIEEEETTTPSLAAPNLVDVAAQYKLMCEIKCGSTVGSIAVGYEDLCGVEQESGYAKLYIPCFEKDKILAFALGSGESDVELEFDEEEDEW